MQKLFELKFGSALYGASTPKSDLDIKSIYLPTAREIVLGTYKKTISVTRPKKFGERNTKDDVDVELLSLDQFFKLLLEGQTMALDILFAPDNMYIEMSDLGRQIMSEIKANQHRLLNKNVNSFVGYAKQQASRYGIKGSRMDAVRCVMDLLNTFEPNSRLGEYKIEIAQLVKISSQLISLEKTPLIEVIAIPGPNKVDMMPHLHVCGRKVPYNATVKHAKDVYGRILDGYGARARAASVAGGIDFKALSHAVRVNAQAQELLETGHITFPRPERQLLIDIKEEKLQYEQVAEIIEQGLADLLAKQEVSTLPEKPDYQWAEDFVCKVYTDVVLNSK